MNATSQATSLEDQLRAVMPATRLVRERHLRKIMHRLVEDGDQVTVHPEMPLWVDRNRLREMDILPDEVFVGTETPLLLVTVPGDRFPVDRPAPDVLRHYWRLLFRASIDWELHKEIDSGVLTADIAHDRLAAFGPEVMLEARYVLEADHVIPHGADALVVYVAFLATVAEFVRFDPTSLQWYFPSLSETDPLVVAIARNRTFDQLFARTRPAGSAEALAPDEDITSTKHERDDSATEPSSEGSGGLLERARRAAGKGNHVRAAILRTRAGASGWSAIRTGLVPRLAAVLNWDEQTARSWGNALGPLLKPASRGAWPRAARALYELQKIPVDLEGGLYTIDPVEWITTLGARRLRRPLTRARVVILYRHLTTAQNQLRRARIPTQDRDRLDALLAIELHRVEKQIRAELGPIVHSVLDEVGLQPKNLPERIARDKVVAELLDRVCGRGFLRIGDLRDAVSRNQLKMPDLEGPAELLRGDPLLQADARLAVELDGVYRRGEVYLRWIQRGTAAAFGTRIGRWVSKYVLFPFGGAFLTVEFARYLAYELGKVYGFVRDLFPRPEDEEAVLDALVGGVGDAVSVPDEVAHHGVAMTPTSAAVTVTLGCLFLALLYWPAFRSAVVAGLSTVWSGIRLLFVALPVMIWRSPPVRAIRDNPVTRSINRHFGTAFWVGAITAIALVLLGAGPMQTITDVGITFVFVALLVNTPLGRRLEDEAAELFTDAWRLLRVNLLPGLVAWVLWLFRTLAGLVERGLYSVDEWFRFREGQSQPSLALKAILALIWFPIAYFVRFAFMLLLEPQINPVKHFPVVTVSHKLLLPLIGAVSDATGLPEATAALIIGGIPGIFGFIAWELKENWRLYAANRSSRLPQVMLGHHGETMRGLLRPGFHSGTVPALYKKLRAAIRKADLTGRPPQVVKQTHGLDDVAHSITNFAERELIPLLRASRSWAGLTPRILDIRVAVQAVTVELDVPELQGSALRMVFVHHDGQIVARVDSPGWLSRLTDEQREVLEVAIAGFSVQGSASPPVSVGRVESLLTWPSWVQFWEVANRQPC